MCESLEYDVEQTCFVSVYPPKTGFSKQPKPNEYM